MDTQLNESYQVCFTAHHDQLFEPAVAHASFSESFPAATTSDRPCEVPNLSTSCSTIYTYLSKVPPSLPYTGQFFQRNLAMNTVETEH